MDSKYLFELVSVKTLPEILQNRLDQGFKAERKGKITHAIKNYQMILQLISTKDEFTYYFQLENDVAKRVKQLEEMQSEYSTSGTTSVSSSQLSIPRSAEENQSGSDEVREKDERVEHVGKLLRFSEQKEVMYYSRFSPPVGEVGVHNEFVSIGHPDYEKLSPLYRQCIRLVLIPLDEAPPYHTTDCLNELKRYFSVSKQFHTEILNQEEEYMSKYVLYFLNQDEQNIRNHTYYTPDSFSVNSKYEYWVSSQLERIQLLKHKLNNVSAPSTSPFFEFAVDNIVGFPIFSRLISSILVHQWGLSFSEPTPSLIRDKLIEIYEFAIDNSPVYGHACFVNLIDDNPSSATSAFLLSTPFTNWLIQTYRIRYGIPYIYYYLAVVDHLTQHFKHTIHHVLLTNYYLDKAYHFFEENETFSVTDLSYFKACVNKLYSLLMQDYLNNILRIYPDEDSILLLEIDLKLLTLILLCSQIGNTKGKLTLEVVMKKAIKKSLRNFYRETYYTLRTSEYNDLDVFDEVNDSHVAICNGQWLSPVQFYTSLQSITNALDQIQAYEDVFEFIGVDLGLVASSLFAEYFLDDLKYYIKNNDLQPPPRSMLEIGVQFKIDLAPNIEIPLDRLFGSFKDKWIENLTKSYTSKIQYLTRSDTWIISKDMISPSMIKVLDIMKMNLEFVLKFDLIFDKVERDFVLERLAETHSISIMRYIEQIYNMFIQQFPQEQHGFLNQIFISNIIGRHSTQHSIGSSKRKSSRELIGKKSQAEISVDVIDMKIEFWSPTTYHVKKFDKYKKTRQKTVILDTMCYKVNNLYFFSTKIKRFLKHMDKISAKETHSFAKKMSTALLSLIEQSILLYIQEEIVYLVKRSKKRISDKTYNMIRTMITYLDDQFEQISNCIIQKITFVFYKNFWNSLFKHLSFLKSTISFTFSQDEVLMYIVNQLKIVFDPYYDTTDIPDQHLFLNLGKTPNRKTSKRKTASSALSSRSVSVNENMYPTRHNITISSSSDQYDLDKSYDSYDAEADLNFFKKNSSEISITRIDTFTDPLSQSTNIHNKHASSSNSPVRRTASFGNHIGAITIERSPKKKPRPEPIKESPLESPEKKVKKKRSSTVKRKLEKSVDNSSVRKSNSRASLSQSVQFSHPPFSTSSDNLSKSLKTSKKKK